MEPYQLSTSTVQPVRERYICYGTCQANELLLLLLYLVMTGYRTVAVVAAVVLFASSLAEPMPAVGPPLPAGLKTHSRDRFLRTNFLPGALKTIQLRMNTNISTST